MMSKFLLFFIIGLDAFILILQTSTISISYHEASLLYGDFSFLQLITQASLYYFGQNDLALRLPMILLHMLSVLLIYTISKKYLQDDRNRIWLVLLFILLPGVLSSAILVDSAGLIIFGLLLFVYVYENYSKKYAYILLSILSVIDGGFVYLFLSLIFFALYSKDKIFFIFNTVAFLLSMFLYGIRTDGLPEGYLLDAIGLYAAVFTPIIFIYIFYILYRRYLTKEIDLLWFISAIVFGFSLLLSFRQSIHIEHFAPYVILALPLAAQTFYSSYRVRLKMFRGKYKTIFVLSLIFLLINSFVVFFNKELYLFIENPKKHFAYKMHVAKELASEIKKRDMACVNIDNDMSKRLKFYGVEKCDMFDVIEYDIHNIKMDNVTISYKNRPIYSASVTKINIK
ncbi:MAG: hypothetical protein NTZ60_08500 [Campylobacterales bacterium]|nr:hypothetical protein [Campylobacterales bacterium]